MLVVLGKKVPAPPPQLAPVATVKPPFKAAIGLLLHSA